MWVFGTWPSSLPNTLIWCTAFRFPHYPGHMQVQYYLQKRIAERTWTCSKNTVKSSCYYNVIINYNKKSFYIFYFLLWEWNKNKPNKILGIKSKIKSKNNITHITHNKTFTIKWTFLLFEKTCRFSQFFYTWYCFSYFNNPSPGFYTTLTAVYASLASDSNAKR